MAGCMFHSMRKPKSARRRGKSPAFAFPGEEMGSNKRADRIGEHRTAYEKNRLIILKTQEICGICGGLVDKKIKPPHPLSPTVDHIIPIAKGGNPSALENLQLAHRWCNRQKSDKLAISIREEKEARDGIGAPEQQINNNDLPLHFDWLSYSGSTA